MDFTKYLNLLEKEGLSLVIVKKDKIVFKSLDHGIKPLLEAIDRVSSELLKDSLVIDKVAGKAGALLICYFSAQEVYAKTISEPAIQVLQMYGIDSNYQKRIKMIQGRKKGESCPFEKAVLEIDDPKAGYEKLSSLAHSLSVYPVSD
jgi:hypothetical protein